jgi:hypothetical protein
MSPRPPRGPARFREREVSRLLRAARAAGENIARIEVDETGKVAVIIGKPGEAKDATEDTPERIIEKL